MNDKAPWNLAIEDLREATAMLTGSHFVTSSPEPSLLRLSAAVLHSASGLRHLLTILGIERDELPLDLRQLLHFANQVSEGLGDLSDRPSNLTDADRRVGRLVADVAQVGGVAPEPGGGSAEIHVDSSSVVPGPESLDATTVEAATGDGGGTGPGGVDSSTPPGLVPRAIILMPHSLCAWGEEPTEDVDDEVCDLGPDYHASIEIDGARLAVLGPDADDVAAALVRLHSGYLSNSAVTR